MLCILSPAKTMVAAGLVEAAGSPLVERSIPLFQDRADVIASVLKTKTKKECKALSGVSDALSTHVKGLYDRHVPGTDATDQSRYNQAALMFDGPAFRGLDASSLSVREGGALQRHLRILTGLYGYVKPGDLIQEHRLCMGTKLQVSESHKDLYSYWGEELALSIVKDLEAQLLLQPGVPSTVPLLINCASQEYSKSVLPHLSGQRVRVVECTFYDGGMIKSAFAKRARGLMARYVCLQGIENGSDDEVDKIKGFNYEGYKYSPAQSSDNNFVFSRSSAGAAANKPAAASRKRKEAAVVNDSNEDEGGDLTTQKQEAGDKNRAVHVGTRSSKRGKQKK